MLTRSRLEADDSFCDEAAARQFMQRWGGHRVPRITEKQVSRETRNAAVRQFFDAHGSDVHATAAQFGIHWRHVQRILNGR